jgi:hypothetical protein
MKKFFATILAFIYLSASMGATVHLHYCMGKLKSWGLIDQDSRNCATCGMAKKTDNSHCVTTKTGCCKDEHKQIKTEKDQKLIGSELQVLLFSPEAVSGKFQTLRDFHLSAVSIDHPNANAPPLTGSQPVFLLNRNFRI